MSEAAADGGAAGGGATAAAPLTIALVGAGDIFSHHASGVLAHPELFSVACVCDPDAARAATASETCGGCPTFPTLTDALAAEQAGAVAFAAVDLMIPHHLHEQVALQAFAAGKHTLLEKPLATSVAACRRILAVSVLFQVSAIALNFPLFA